MLLRKTIILIILCLFTSVSPISWANTDRIYLLVQEGHTMHVLWVPLYTNDQVPRNLVVVYFSLSAATVPFALYSIRFRQLGIHPFCHLFRFLPLGSGRF